MRTRAKVGMQMLALSAADDPTTFVETWHEVSWLNHLRHHKRVTESERTLQSGIQALLKREAKPQVEHFLAASDQPAKAATGLSS